MQVKHAIWLSKMGFCRDFSGGLVVRAQHFHCCDPGFNP